MSKKRRIVKLALGYYGPYLPYYLAELSLKSHYDPDLYSNNFIKLGLPTRPKKGFLKKKSKLWMMYISFGYYFWVIYIAACLAVLTFSIIGGILGLLMLPLILSSGFYSLNYVVNFLGLNKKLKS